MKNIESLNEQPTKVKNAPIINSDINLTGTLVKEVLCNNSNVTDSIVGNLTSNLNCKLTEKPRDDLNCKLTKNTSENVQARGVCCIYNNCKEFENEPVDTKETDSVSQILASKGIVVNENEPNYSPLTNLIPNQLLMLPSLSKVCFFGKVVMSVFFEFPLYYLFIMTAKIQALAEDKGLDLDFMVRLKSQEGVSIGNKNYKIYPETHWDNYPLAISRSLQPTSLRKEELLNKGLYDVNKEGVEYENEDNFYEFAAKTTCNWTFEKSINDIYCDFGHLEEYAKSFSNKKYTGIFEEVPLKVAIYTNNPIDDFEKIKQVCLYLWRNPMEGVSNDKPFVEFQIDSNKWLRFSLKVHPCPENNTPGAIWAELIVKCVAIDDLTSIPAILKEEETYLKYLAKYVFDCISIDTSNNHEAISAIKKYSKLRTHAVKEKIIPKQLIEHFMVIDCASLKNRYVLKPELLLPVISRN